LDHGEPGFAQLLLPIRRISTQGPQELFSTVEPTPGSDADIEMVPAAALGTEFRKETHHAGNLCRGEAEPIRNQFLHPPRHAIKRLLDTHEHSEQPISTRGSVVYEFIDEIDHCGIERIRPVSALRAEKAGIGDVTSPTAIVHHRQAFLTLTEIASWDVS
jgi:hypothetical protein